MSTDMLAFLVSLSGCLFAPGIGSVVGLLLGYKAKREGIDTWMTKWAIITGWLGLVPAVILACAALVLGALALIGGETPSPEIAPTPNVPIPASTSTPESIRMTPTPAQSQWLPPLLGVECEDTPNGAQISRVVPRTPAAEVGLAVGDVIVAVDSRQIGNCSELRASIRSRSAGDRLQLLVRRGNETFQVTVVLAER